MPNLDNLGTMIVIYAPVVVLIAIIIIATCRR